MINTAGTTWPPILADDLADRARAVVGDIARSLLRPPPAWIPDATAEPYRRARGASLAQGRAGLALFYAYLLQSDVDVPDVDAGAAAEGYLDEACDVLESTPLSAGFMRGFTGVLWAVHHLQGRYFAADTGPLAMADVLRGYAVPREGFDLWQGIVGHGVYALEGLPDAAAAGLVADVVDRLAANAGQNNAGACWITRSSYLKPAARRRYPRDHHSLGAAHGQAGVIAFLARACAAGAAPERARRLTAEAVGWLLAQVARDESGSFVPANHVPTDDPALSMETWCNGTPGVAASILLASSCCDQPDWRRAAVDLARDAAGRSLARETRGDASLCHGAGGEALLWHRFHAATDEPVFATAARKWYEHTLDMRRPGDGVGGYVALGHDVVGDVVELHEPGLMQGAAGVGLALLAGLGGQAPAWDRLLQLSTAQYPDQHRDESE